jgi:ribosomal protein S18 acetylase RimI-like enzyme
MNTTNVTINLCNFDDSDQQAAVGNLMNAYIADKMGGGDQLSPTQLQQLVEGLTGHPTTIALLAKVDGIYVGLITAFELFSTFTVKPMIYIHDVFVLSQYRSLGIGRHLMETIVAEGKRRNCSRISLEVRHDNAPAQSLYKSIGFVDTEPPMYYWRKNL